MMRTFSIKIYLLMLALTVCLVPWAGDYRAYSQIPQNGWVQPVNISRSGSSINPALAIDSKGTFHVYWQDIVNGIGYSSLSENGWSDPVYPEYDFDIVPVMVSDGAGYLHAFWITGNNQLFYSRVISDFSGNSEAWDAPRILGSGVASFDVAVIQGNHLHVAYAQNTDEQSGSAGIYYLTSISGGTGWTAPVALYRSKYYRSLTDEMITVHISATIVEDAEHVYASWDNQSRKRVYLAKSLDAGKSWSEPFEIDGPDPNTTIVAPFSLDIKASGSNVLAVWKSNLQSGFDCTQYYQWSSDGGSTWSERRSMLREFVGCPMDNQFLDGPDNNILFSTTIDDQLFLLAWNGNAWSTPQLQGELETFVDPDTLYQLGLACHSFAEKENSIYLVGCDTVESKDIWLTSRSLSDISSWFPTQSSWDAPSIVYETRVSVADPELIIDSNGVSHLFWIQIDENKADSKKGVIYHSALENNQWTTAIPILSSPDGNVQNLEAAASLDDRIFVVWSGGLAGEIHFSMAKASLSKSAHEWSKPVFLPMPGLAGSTPDIAVDQSGAVLVVYSVPYNENRGVYLVRMDIATDEWSSPIQIFDAVVESWDTLGNTALSVSGNGTIHVGWQRLSFPGGGGPQGVYYSRSPDGGANWEPPLSIDVSDVSASWITSTASGVVQRVWQSIESDQPTNYFLFSLDGGTSWSNQLSLSNFGENPGTGDFIKSNNDTLFILQEIRASSGGRSLYLSGWQGTNWVLQDKLELDLLENDNVLGLSADTYQGNKLPAAYLVVRKELYSSSNVYRLYYLEITVEPGQTEVTPDNIATIDAAATPTGAETGNENSEEIDAALTEVSQLTQTALSTPLNTPNPLSSEETSANPSYALVLLLAGSLAVLVAAGVVIAVMLSRQNRK